MSADNERRIGYPKARGNPADGIVPHHRPTVGSLTITP